MRHLLLLFVRAPAGGSCVSLRLIPRESLILPSRGANLSPGKAPRRRCEFAPHSRESLILPSRGANPSPGKSPRRRREFAPHTRESLILPLRGANPSPGKAPPPPAGVCASLPGKPYSYVERRKSFAGKRRRRLREFAPHSRESLILPLRGANPAPGKGAGGSCVSLRPIPRKGLFFR